MKNRLIELLSDDLIDLDLDTSPELAAEHLILYLMEWKRWNAKINLTAEHDELSVINKHIFIAKKCQSKRKATCRDA